MKGAYTQNIDHRALEQFYTNLGFREATKALTREQVAERMHAICDACVFAGWTPDHAALETAYNMGKNDGYRGMK